MPQNDCVASPLDKELGDFLRRMRGGQTFAQFSRKVGLPPSTLYRLERCEQSITLGRLYQVMVRLNCGLQNIFSMAVYRTTRNRPPRSAR
jgi:transcriptional regulator with XRE-family HTH domain